ncbi:MAG: hypothetical protein QF415_11360 [Candidatus Undinarchaeales archaeon]|jgi:hypothetical protein|nr:hypothetical protein [Candidatus Undinarchaeales archaeon]MDP7494278.1 hypothetical protein [Candidatus Undinarchaeales archaeon]
MVEIGTAPVPVTGAITELAAYSSQAVDGLGGLTPYVGGALFPQATYSGEVHRYETGDVLSERGGDGTDNPWYVGFSAIKGFQFTCSFVNDEDRTATAYRVLRKLHPLANALGSTSPGSLLSGEMAQLLGTAGWEASERYHNARQLFYRAITRDMVTGREVIGSGPDIEAVDDYFAWTRELDGQEPELELVEDGDPHRVLTNVRLRHRDQTYMVEVRGMDTPLALKDENGVIVHSMTDVASALAGFQLGLLYYTFEHPDDQMAQVLDAPLERGSCDRYAEAAYLDGMNARWSPDGTVLNEARVDDWVRRLLPYAREGLTILGERGTVLAPVEHVLEHGTVAVQLSELSADEQVREVLGRTT